MELFDGQILWVAIFANILAQAIKVVVFPFTEKERRWVWTKFFETGGMPSSHSALVTSLAIAIGLVHGWNSTLFGMAVIFGGIVIHDATGVRRHAGLHAQRLNEFAERLNELTKAWEHLFNDSPKPDALRTLLGHSYPQVIAGMILGALVSLLAYYWIGYLTPEPDLFF